MTFTQKVLLFFTLPYWILISLLYCQHNHADQEPRYKIAVIDSGYDPARAYEPAKLCKTGHYDFFTKTANVAYYHVHGTHVADVLVEKLKDVDYCLIIFQVFTETFSDGPKAGAKDIAQALHDSIGLGVTAINMSFGSFVAVKEEEQALKATATVPIPAFVAAGNDHMDLDKKCGYFPACYSAKNIVIVGAQDIDVPKMHAEYSNYGKRVSVWAPGYFNKGEESGWKYGTSYAAPRALAEYILFLEHKRLQVAHKKK